MVLRELLSGSLTSADWSWRECWIYSASFKAEYEKSIKQGIEPDPEDDVAEEMHCWTE